MYGIYANIWGIWMGSMLPYIAAPWILWDMVYECGLKNMFFSMQAVRCAEQSYRPARTIRIRGARCSGWWWRKMLILLGGNEKPRGTIRKPMVLFFLLMFLNAKIGLVFKGKSSPETMVLTMKYG